MKQYIPLLALVFTLQGLQGQTPVAFQIATQTSQRGELVCLEVRTQHFSQLIGFQWALRWDTTALTFTEVMPQHPLFGLENFGANTAASGRMAVSWTHLPAQEPFWTTLPDSTLLFSLCFRAKTNAPQGFTYVAFEDSPPAFPTEIIADDGIRNFILLPGVFRSGGVDIQTTTNSLQVKAAVQTRRECDSLLVELSAQVAGGTPPYQYQWTDPNGQAVPAQGSSILAAMQGVYQLKVTDQDGLSSHASLFAKAMQGDFPMGSGSLIESSTVIADSCGRGTGDIRLQVAGNSSQYTFRWEDGQTQPTATNLDAGTYQVTVTNELGCEQTRSFTVPMISIASYELQFDSITCTSPGSIAVIHALGTPFSYAWNTGSNQSGIEVSQPGNYQVMLTDLTSGCRQMENIPVPPPPVISASAAISCQVAALQCDPMVAINIQTSTGRSPFTYRWNDDVESNTDQSNVTRLVPNFATFSVTVTDARGCSRTLTELQGLCPDATLRGEIYLEKSRNSGEPRVEAEVVGAGTPPYQFTWNSGETTTSYFRSGISQTDPQALYAVSIVDANGKSIQLNLNNGADYGQPGNNAHVTLMAPQVSLAPGQSGVLPVRLSNYRLLEKAQLIYSWNACLIRVDSIIDYSYPEPRLFIYAGNPSFDQGYFNAELNANSTLSTADTALIQEVFFTAHPSDIGVSPFLFQLDNAPAFTANSAASLTTLSGAIALTDDQNALILPGDVNRNGQINHFDLLPLGYRIGATGPDRRQTRATDQPEFSFAWGSNFPATQIDLRQGDANGDGRIDTQDAALIDDRWVTGTPESTLPSQPTGIPFYVAIDTLLADQATMLPIMLGDAATAATNAYGVAFTLQIDPKVLPLDSLQWDFSGSWLTAGTTPAMSLIRADAATGRLYVSMVRADAQGVNGQGPIGMLRVNSNAIVGAEVDFQITDVRFLQANGQELRVHTPVTQGKVITVTSIRELTEALRAQIKLFPNPGSDRLQLLSGNLVINRLEILDIRGQRIRTINNPGSVIAVADLPSGGYWLRVVTPDGVTSLSWIKQ